MAISWNLGQIENSRCIESVPLVAEIFDGADVESESTQLHADHYMSRLAQC